MLHTMIVAGFLAVPGGQELRVPRDFPTIEAAVAAITGPGAVVVIAPGTYLTPPLIGPPECQGPNPPFYCEAPQLDCKGALLLGEASDPAAVVLVDYFIYNGSIQMLTIKHGLQGFAPTAEVNVATDCVLEDCYLSWFGSFDHCLLIRSGWSAATLTDCTVVEGGLVGTTTADRTTFTATTMIGVGHMLDCVLDGCSVVQQWWPPNNFQLRRCLLKNSVGVAFVAFGCTISHCTFVSNGGDFSAGCSIDQPGGAYVTNSIGTAVPPNPDVFYDCTTLCRVLQADGNVDANGFVIPGSAAIGSGYWAYTQPDYPCSFNIGWDQTGAPADCAYELGDLNSDGLVDGVDLGLLLTSWGASSVIGDADCDVGVGPGDLGILLANWTG